MIHPSSASPFANNITVEENGYEVRLKSLIASAFTEYVELNGSSYI